MQKNDKAEEKIGGKVWKLARLWDTCIPFVKHKYGSRAVQVSLASRTSVLQTGNK